MMIGNQRAGHGSRWDDDADAELRRRVEAGQFLPEIAAGMGRTQEAVRSRANILKIPVRSSAGRRPAQPRSLANGAEQ
jgi:hypothetical protein